MQNFDYLKEIPYLSDLYAYCHTAERTQRTNPGASALSGRQALEWLVRAIYQMKNIEVDTSRKRASLFELVDGEPFKDFVENDRLMEEVPYEKAEWEELKGEEILNRIRKAGTGALPITGSGTPEEFYRDADRLLYQAKEQGRDRFIMGSPDADGGESGAIP